jgi:serine/threonine protein kinase
VGLYTTSADFSGMRLTANVNTMGCSVINLAPSAKRLLKRLMLGLGMLYLHSHKPIMLHRDLKSPNLFVTK